MFNDQCSLDIDRWSFGRLERDGKPDFGSAAEADAGPHLCRTSRSCAHARGDQGIHRAQHVVGEEKADLILRAAEGVVAAADVILEYLVLERMISPAPEEIRADGAGLI